MNLTYISEKLQNLPLMADDVNMAFTKAWEALNMLSSAISTLIFLPFKYLGITLPGGVAQLIYFGLLAYLIFKLGNSWKIAIGIMVILVLISIPQLSLLI